MDEERRRNLILSDDALARYTRVQKAGEIGRSPRIIEGARDCGVMSVRAELYASAFGYSFRTRNELVGIRVVRFASAQALSPC